MKLLDKLLKEQTTEFWGNTYTFQPQLLDKVFGDAKRLLQVFPMMERPRYWVVRVDSSCNDDDAVHEIVDDIYEAIEEQFGCPDDDDIGVGDDRPYFPMIDDNGVAWHINPVS